MQFLLVTYGSICIWVKCYILGLCDRLCENQEIQKIYQNEVGADEAKTVIKEPVLELKSLFLDQHLDKI